MPDLSRPRILHGLATLVLLGGCLFLVVSLAGAVSSNLLGDFAAGRFPAARIDLQEADQAVTDGGSRLVIFLLTEDPGQASALLNSLTAGQADSRRAWATRAALEKANLAFAQRDFSASLAALEPVLAGDSESLPGILHLRAGLACRGLGLLQRAREMLASVRPEDPVFGRARFFLGDIALEQGDPGLALRYFNGASQALPPEERSAVAQARWRALAALGRQGDAAAVRAEFGNETGGGLSWLSQGSLSRMADVPVDNTTTPGTVAGRFCLQWAAFRDRSLALDFVRENQGRLPDLRIVPGTDAGGITLYRIRSGSFNDPQEARRRAEQLKDALGLEVMVTTNE